MGIARLPVPGKDEGRWGDILNEYLLVAHNEDGSLRSDAPTGGVVDEVYVTNAIQGKVNRSELSNVATTGSYSDLINKPSVVLNDDPRLSNARTPLDNSVTTNKIADESVTEPKLSISNSPSTGDFLAWDGSQLEWQAQASSAVQSVAGRTGVVTLTKADVGLGNVDNTTDANKPISSATQTALNLKADTASLSAVATTGNYNDLSGRPTIPLAGTSAGTYAAGNDARINGALQTTTYTTKGDIVAATGAGAVNRLAVGADGQVLVADSSQASGIRWTAPASAPVTSVAGRTGAVTLTSTDVGLGNVSNTSDANKPISTATQTALNAKADTSALASVATSGDYNDLFNQPTLPTAGTGSSNYAVGNDPRITGALQTSVVTAKGDLLAGAGNNAINRVAIGSDGQVLAVDSSQPAGVRWTTPASAPVSSVAGRTGVVTLTASDVGLANVNNTSDANKPISSATQTALDAKASISSLATVATSGSYADLSSKPVIPTAGTGLTNSAGSLSVNYGTTGTTAAAGNDSRITGALQATIATTKGDVLAATGSGSFNRLGVGTDGQVLTADSSQATGLKWSTVTSGGGGSGISRSIVSVGSNQTAAAAAHTDYIYILTGNYTLTLPTAVGNENMYTIKNRHSASVAIAFYGSETADGGSVTLSANSSVDLVSDGTNWVII